MSKKHSILNYYQNNPEANTRRNAIRRIQSLLDAHAQNQLTPPEWLPQWGIIADIPTREWWQIFSDIWNNNRPAQGDVHSGYTPRLPTALERALWPRYYTDRGPQTYNENIPLERPFTNTRAIAQRLYDQQGQNLFNTNNDADICNAIHSTTTNRGNTK